MAKQRKQRRHNPVARALAQPVCRPRIVSDRKRAARAGYSKHRTKEQDQ
jgi:hypothetical protein